MDIIVNIFTYNRPKVLNSCVSSLLNNEDSKHFSEINFYDDCSEDQLKYSLLDFSIKNSKFIPINLYLNGKNYHYAYNFKLAYNKIKIRNPDLVFFVESDYVFRPGFMQEVLDVFENNPYCLAMPGTSHPDYHDQEKIKNLFPNVMKGFLGEDIPERELYFKPFDQTIKNKNFKLQAVSNSCGCFFFNYKRLKETILSDMKVRDEFNEKIFNAIETDVEINGVKMFDDGKFTSILTYYWSKWANLNSIDTTKNFPWLDICDYSIGNHLCALGVNGKLPGLKEGETFVGSPKWQQEYLNKKIERS